MVETRQLSSKMAFALACVTVALTLLSGVIYGRISQRWGASQELQTAGNELRELSKKFGVWETIEEQTISDLVIETVEATGWVQRTYSDGRGNEIRMAVLVGPPGPISVHTPEICYSSQNTQTIDKSRIEIGSSENTFWMVEFKPESLAATPFRVFYAFSEDFKTWTATDNPRVAYGGADLLYKLQLASYSRVATNSVDPAEEFLKEFLARRID